MSKHLELGRLGEKLAVEYLQKRSYEILELNWRFSRAEIDIIARKDGILVFVEVKTRSCDYFGQPEDAVNKHKELMIADAAAAYMREKNYEWEIRFDIISIVKKKNKDFKISHFVDAFFPGIT